MAAAKRNAVAGTLDCDPDARAHKSDVRPVATPRRRGGLGRFLLCAEATRADMHSLHSAVDQDLGLLDVGVEHAVGLRRAQLPLSAVVVPDVAAEHLALTAEIALSHEHYSKTVKNSRGQRPRPSASECSTMKQMGQESVGDVLPAAASGGGDAGGVPSSPGPTRAARASRLAISLLAERMMYQTTATASRPRITKLATMVTVPDMAHALTPVPDGILIRYA
jgi:hypothetical protein